MFVMYHSDGSQWPAKQQNTMDGWMDGHLYWIKSSKQLYSFSEQFSEHNNNTHLTTLCLGLPGSASARKVKPIWIYWSKKDIASGSGISWAICKSAPQPRKITMPASHHSVFYRPNALPATNRVKVNTINQNTPDRLTLVLFLIYKSAFMQHSKKEWQSRVYLSQAQTRINLLQNCAVPVAFNKAIYYTSEYCTTTNWIHGTSYNGSKSNTFTFICRPIP